MKGLDTKWILIGAATNVSLFVGLKFALNAWLGGTNILMNVLTSGAAVLMSYPLGGALIGYFSPGETIKEAGWAAGISLTLAWTLRATLAGQLPGVAAVAFEIVLAWALAVLGAKIGERIQGDTPEKQAALALESDDT